MRAVSRWTNGRPVLCWSESGDSNSLCPALLGNDQDKKREVNAVTLP